MWEQLGIMLASAIGGGGFIKLVDLILKHFRATTTLSAKEDHFLVGKLMKLLDDEKQHREDLQTKYEGVLLDNWRLKSKESP